MTRKVGPRLAGFFLIRTIFGPPEISKLFRICSAGLRLTRTPIGQSISGLKLTESGSYRITQKHKAAASQGLSYYYYI